MKNLRAEYFKCIMEENSNEKREKQWKLSKVIFDSFYKYLKAKGLKKSVARERAGLVSFFIMDYVFVYEDFESALEIDGDTVRKFLGNCYIRKFIDPNIATINAFLRAILDFFTFLRNKGLVGEWNLNEIKEVCKDTKWFEMRLKTYFETEGEDFHRWLEEYNYEKL